MRKLFFIIILLLVPLFLFSKEIRSQRFKNNNIDYVVFYSDEKSFPMNNMRDFFTFFESRLQKLCFQFNTRMPNSLRVNITMGAWIFKSLTGKDRYVAGEMRMDMSIINFLKDWIINHILTEDRKYGPFLNDKGVT